MELDTRTPKGRGKRRGAANTPVNNDTRTLRKGRRGSQQAFTAPPSPAKSESSVGGLKRKGRPQDIDLSIAEQRSTKRSRSGSQAPTPNSETPPTDELGFIECPEPNCNKKYRNANGLKYHQSHAHSSSNSNLSMDDTKDEMDCEDIPLSVVKNSVKKEKDNKKESNSVGKKDKEKDKLNSSEKKSEKTSDASKKSEKSDDNEIQSKDKSVKSDTNSSSSKKKDKESAGNSKTNAQSSATSSGKFSNNGVPKSVGNNTNNSTLSSQVNSTNSVPVQSVTSQASSFVTSSASLSMTSSSITSSSALVMQSTQGDINRSDTNTNITTSSKLVDIKPKLTHENVQRVTKPNRPIVPAPTHTVLSNMQVTHSNLSPVMSHTQMSPQLKPIQPKPTIMGEPQNINPALADLNKDRKKQQKKKPKDGFQNGNNNSVKIDQPTIKIERTGVIKTNPMPTNKTQADGHRKDSSTAAARDLNRSHLMDSNRSHSLAQQGQQKNYDSSQPKSGHNPNLLKVGDPLQVNTPDKGSVNDDVQSPAYSDISDANESASPAAPSDSSPHKHKEDSASNSSNNKQKDKTDNPNPAISEGQMMPHYGMYGSYYGQAQYMNNMSPGQKSANQGNPGPNMQQQQQQQQSQGGSEGSMKSSMQNRDKGSSTPTEEQSKGERRPEGDKDNGRPKGLPPHMAGVIPPPPPNLSPQQMQEYQMMCAQQMYHMQSAVPHQYPYMPNGWYPQGMDPNYMRQMMEDQRRAQQSGEPGNRNDREQGSKAGSDRERESSLGPEGAKTSQGPLQGSSKKDDIGSRPLPSPHSAGGDPNKKGEDKSHSAKDQALREKQSENHQILKENIDIKNEMDRRQEYERGRQEELRRYKMYQEQKQIEERKKMELARKGENRQETLAAKVPGTKPIVDPSRGSSSQRSGSDPSKDINIKREMPDPRYKDSRDMNKDNNSSSKYQDSRGDDKSKTPVSDKHRSETPTRNPENPKQRPGGSSSKSGSPCSMGPTSIPGSPSYSPYVNSYPYAPHMQSPHFLGIDPTHPMYRNHNVNPALLGYHGSPYIHPSQIGYRTGCEIDEKDMKLSAQQKSSVNNPSDSDRDLKKSVSTSDLPHYSGNTVGNMHKIHELSEKGRPKSRNSSPGPVKPSSDSTNSVNTSGFDKHRDGHREFANSPPTQRHVHTHHHTHVLQPGPGMQPAGGPLPGAPGFPPVYDPYSAMFVSQAQSPHPYPPK